MARKKEANRPIIREPEASLLAYDGGGQCAVVRSAEDNWVIENESHNGRGKETTNKSDIRPRAKVFRCFDIALSYKIEGQL